MDGAVPQVSTTSLRHIDLLKTLTSSFHVAHLCWWVPWVYFVWMINWISFSFVTLLISFVSHCVQQCSVIIAVCPYLSYKIQQCSVIIAVCPYLSYKIQQCSVIIAVCPYLSYKIQQCSVIIAVCPYLSYKIQQCSVIIEVCPYLSYKIQQCSVIIEVCPYLSYKIPFCLNKYSNLSPTSFCGISLVQLTVAELVVKFSFFYELGRISDDCSRNFSTEPPSESLSFSCQRHTVRLVLVLSSHPHTASISSVACSLQVFRLQ
jgi:hypothetical protein